MSKRDNQIDSLYRRIRCKEARYNEIWLDHVIVKARQLRTVQVKLYLFSNLCLQHRHPFAPSTLCW